MRTREEIMKKTFSKDSTPMGWTLNLCQLILEVVLDCRDLLLEKKNEDQ